ncbi:MAG: hypothetical protein ACYCQI_01060 [Gammaproteobacteria bacterium]
MKVAISSQPERKSQLLLRSMNLYRLSFTHVFYLALTVSIIAFIPRLFTLMIGQDIFTGVALLNPRRLWLIVIDLGCLMLFTAIIWRIRCVITDAHESILDDIEVAIKKLPYIIVSSFLQFLLLYVVTFFFFVLAYFLIFHHNMPELLTIKDEIVSSSILLVQFTLIMYIFFALYFYLPIIVIENKTILPSLRKSAFLVWSNWWKTFLVQITPWIAYLIIIIIINAITKLNLHVYFVPATQNQSWLATIVHIFLFALFIPFFATTMLVQLRDLELRKEKL